MKQNGSSKLQDANLPNKGCIYCSVTVCRIIRLEITTVNKLGQGKFSLMTFAMKQTWCYNSVHWKITQQNFPLVSQHLRATRNWAPQSQTAFLCVVFSFCSLTWGFDAVARVCRADASPQVGIILSLMRRRRLLLEVSCVWLILLLL